MPTDETNFDQTCKKVSLQPTWKDWKLSQFRLNQMDSIAVLVKNAKRKTQKKLTKITII